MRILKTKIRFSGVVAACCSSVILLLCFLFTITAAASPTVTDIPDLQQLKGVDTFIVELERGPHFKILDDKFADGLAYKKVFNAVTKLFSNQKNVSVVSTFSSPSGDKTKAILMRYILSSQLDFHGQEKLKLASLSVKYYYFSADGTPVELAMWPATFPFIVHDEKSEFLEKLEDGVFQLGFIAFYHKCANLNSVESYERCAKVAKKNPWRYFGTGTSNPPPPILHRTIREK